MPSPVVFAVVNTQTPPPAGARLVLFSDTRNYVAEYDSGSMLAAAARYAKTHGVYVVPERFIVEDYLCLCMLSPDGSPLGVQRACHLNMDYRGRFRRWNKLEPFTTPFGRVALLVDVDCNMPQVSRAAAAGGAELLIASQFIQLFDFFEDRILCGAVNAARTSGLPVAATVGAGAVAVEGGGTIIKGYTESLPFVAELRPSRRAVDAEAIKTGKRLLAAHRELLVDETGGTPYAQDQD